MPQTHRDHGVAARANWLRQELAGRPLPLHWERRREAPSLPPEPQPEPALRGSRQALAVGAGLLAAGCIYLVLRAAGVLPPLAPPAPLQAEEKTAVTATFPAELRAGPELAFLHALLARRTTPTGPEEGSPPSVSPSPPPPSPPPPSPPPKNQQPPGDGGPEPDPGLLPTLPPPLPPLPVDEVPDLPIQPPDLPVDVPDLPVEVP